MAADAGLIHPGGTADPAGRDPGDSVKDWSVSMTRALETMLRKTAGRPVAATETEPTPETTPPAALSGIDRASISDETSESISALALDLTDPPEAVADPAERGPLQPFDASMQKGEEQAREPVSITQAKTAERTNDDMDPEPGIVPDDMTFVPPYDLIMKHIGVDPKGDGNDEMKVPRKLLDFLFRCLLANVDFDEQQYRKCNPDVAEAIKRKKALSGREHFIKSGYFEGRTGGVPVHETWYLARNPDVAAAKKAGKIASGELQYRMAGAHEWREPNPQSVGAVRMWRDVLGN